MRKDPLKLRPLTKKEQVFLKEYFSNGKHARNAYKAASPDSTLTERGMSTKARLFMLRPPVAAELNKAKGKELAVVEKTMGKLEITKEKVLLELAKIAFSDLKDTMTWGPDGANAKPMDDLGEEVTGAVSEVTQTTSRDGNVNVKVKLHDKQAALTSLAKHLGLLEERDNRRQLAVQFIIEK